MSLSVVIFNLEEIKKVGDLMSLVAIVFNNTIPTSSTSSPTSSSSWTPCHNIPHSWQHHSWRSSLSNHSGVRLNSRIYERWKITLRSRSSLSSVTIWIFGLPGFGLVGDPKLPSHSPALLVPPLSFKIFEKKSFISSFYQKDQQDVDLARPTSEFQD